MRYFGGGIGHMTDGHSRHANNAGNPEDEAADAGQSQHVDNGSYDESTAMRSDESSDSDGSDGDSDSSSDESSDEGDFGPDAFDFEHYDSL